MPRRKESDLIDSGKKASGLSRIIGVFDHQVPEEFLDEAISESRTLRKALKKNPEYRKLMQQAFYNIRDKYGDVFNWGKVIDKWDRVTSAAGLAAELVPGAGTIVDSFEEIPELVPKAIYAVDYVKKTGDFLALPYWAVAEGLSFIPVVGDLIDFANIYFNRARKKTKQAIEDEFKRLVKENSSSLESMASQAA